MYKKYITEFEESAKLSQVGALLTDREGAGRYRLANQKISSIKKLQSTLINHYFSLLYDLEYRRRHFKCDNPLRAMDNLSVQLLAAGGIYRGMLSLRKILQSCRAHYL